MTLARFHIKLKGREKIMINGIKDQWGQLRKRAVLVDRLNKKCLDANWRPLLSESELEDANHRLDEAFSIWQWRWTGNSVSLAGTVNLAEKSENAQLQFSTSCYSV